MPEPEKEEKKKPMVLDADRLTLDQLLSFMQKHGSSVLLNWGEDNNSWEASWISGGERFSDVSSSPRVALRKVLENVLSLERVSGADMSDRAIHRYLAEYMRALKLLVSSEVIMPEIPTLDINREHWTPEIIGLFTGVPVSTVRRWCRSTYPEWEGDFRMNCQQAQKVVDKMFSYGYKKTALKSSERQVSVK